MYPVYWWSMPGLLKGWIDRVFANGWAYDDNPEVGLVQRLGRLRVHLAIGEPTSAPMRGADTSGHEDTDRPGNLETARRLGRQLFTEPSPRAADNAP